MGHESFISALFAEIERRGRRSSLKLRLTTQGPSNVMRSSPGPWSLVHLCTKLRSSLVHLRFEVPVQSRFLFKSLSTNVARERSALGTVPLSGMPIVVADIVGCVAALAVQSSLMSELMLSESL